MRRVGVVLAFMRRDWTIDTSYRFTFAIGLFGAVFTLALFYFLGQIVDQGAFPADQDGYFGFVAVGATLYSVLQTVLGSFSRKLREEQTTGTFEVLMSTPVSPSLLILSSATYEVVKGLLNGLVVLVAAVVIFGLTLDLSADGLFVAVTAMAMSLTLFAAVGIVTAGATVLFKRATVLVAIVVTSLALLGGVYFPIDVLPTPLEEVASILPFTWSLDLLRASLLGGVVDPAQFAGLIASAIVLLPLSLLAFDRAVQRARNTGTLGHY